MAKTAKKGSRAPIENPRTVTTAFAKTGKKTVILTTAKAPADIPVPQNPLSSAPNAKTRKRADAFDAKNPDLENVIRNSPRVGKSDIADDVRKVLAVTTMGSKVTLRELDFVVKLIFATVRNKISSGSVVNISGFGVFSLQSRPGRILTQASGRVIQVPAHNVIRFKPSDILRKLSNSKMLPTAIPIPPDLYLVAIPKSARPLRKNGKRKGEKVVAAAGLSTKSHRK